MSTGTRANLVRFANEARFAHRYPEASYGLRVRRRIKAPSAHGGFAHSPLRGKCVKSEFVTILT